MRSWAWVAAVPVVLAVTCGRAEPVDGPSEPNERPGPVRAEPAHGLPRSARRLELAETPYMGVSCPRRPNVISCDQVGLAVWLKRPARRLEAWVAGRRVEMTAHGEFVTGPRGTAWEGYLQPAGLRDGPLQVEPDCGPGCWESRKPVYATVELRAHDRRGRAFTRRVRVQLHPGWG